MAESRGERLFLEYTLEFLAPFHCGTGARVGLIDRTVVRDHDGYLYVPGSTVKGVVREQCERLASLYEGDDRVLKALSTPHVTAQTLLDFGGWPTMITRLFGSSLRPGSLSFDDASQSQQDRADYDGPDPQHDQRRYQPLQVDVFTQVRLDRPTRTAVPGALYTSEYGVRGMMVRGSISGTLACVPIRPEFDPYFTSPAAGGHTVTYSLLLLLAGLSLLERLGGNRSTGKGQCRCAIDEVVLGGKTVEKEQWQSWLEHLDALAYYSLLEEEV